jgi:hypothetical protein
VYATLSLLASSRVSLSGSQPRSNAVPSASRTPADTSRHTFTHVDTPPQSQDALDTRNRRRSFTGGLKNPLTSSAFPCANIYPQTFTSGEFHMNRLQCLSPCVSCLPSLRRLAVYGSVAVSEQQNSTISVFTFLVGLVVDGDVKY